jgi:hypothetical protein
MPDTMGAMNTRFPAIEEAEAEADAAKARCDQAKDGKRRVKRLFSY